MREPGVCCTGRDDVFLLAAAIVACERAAERLSEIARYAQPLSGGWGSRGSGDGRGGIFRVTGSHWRL